MKLNLILALFTVLLVNDIAHADPKFWLYQKMLLKQQYPVMKIDGNVSGDTLKSGKQTAVLFDQILDHFAKGPVTTKTFKQRYFIDSTYATGANSPVFYYFCGESACTGATDAADVNELARKYHAHRIALEHRYYGESQPFKTHSTPNLKYLSMDQALEDLAYFQKYAQNILKLRGRWISVGGSYPGELSAFYRMKYPELVVGALASSAPVLAKSDFFEYDHHVAKVAGPVCLSAMQKVVADVEVKLHQTDSSAAVKKLFNADAVKNDVDFLYVIADMGAAAIQYGFQDTFCKTLVDGIASGKATEAYAHAGNQVFARLGTNSFDDSFQSAESDVIKDLRPWMYQSCTEFGFYQTAYANPAESSRSQQISLAYHNDACKRMFGITTPVNADLTNQNFYQKLFDPKVTNILFTNGSNDPWSNLSITTASAVATNPGLQFFVLNGGSHCSDLGSRMTAAVSQAQDLFDSLVGKWLTE